MMDETECRGIVAESERTQKYKCRLYCNLSCWQIFRYDVPPTHHLPPFLFSTGGQISRIPSASLLPVGKHQGNLGRSLKHLFESQFDTLSQQSLPPTSVIFKCWLFSSLVSFPPTYELGVETECQGRPVLLCES